MQVVNGGVFAAGESYRSQYSVVQTFREFYREYRHLAAAARTDWQARTYGNRLRCHLQSMRHLSCVGCRQALC